MVQSDQNPEERPPFQIIQLYRCRCGWQTPVGTPAEMDRFVDHMATVHRWEVPEKVIKAGPKRPESGASEPEGQSENKGG